MLNLSKELHPSLQKTTCSKQVLAERNAWKEKDKCPRILRLNRSPIVIAKNSDDKNWKCLNYSLFICRTILFYRIYIIHVSHYKKFLMNLKTYFTCKNKFFFWSSNSHPVSQLGLIRFSWKPRLVYVFMFVSLDNLGATDKRPSERKYPLIAGSNSEKASEKRPPIWIAQVAFPKHFADPHRKW